MNYFDDLCNKLFGFTPTKKGTSYEIIVDCVILLLNQDAEVTHNHFEKSAYSKDTFQLDGLLEKDKELVRKAIEAKNYLDGQKKVDRADIQKLAGALIVQDTHGGIFASATDFTVKARQYAKDLKAARSKPISLYVIRPIKEEDTKDSILGVKMEINVLKNDWHNATIFPVLTQKGKEKLISLGYTKENPFPYTLEYFYNEQGEIIDSIFKISSRCSGKGIVDFSKSPTFFPIQGHMIEIKELQYEVSTKITRTHFEIFIDPVIYVKSEDPIIDRWFDKRLLQQAFNILNTRHHWI